MIAILLFFVLHWYLSLFSQTFFLHRYAAHGAFTMSRGWERFFFIVTYLTQGSSYLSPRAYGIMHRLHHAHTDTEDDPHSPTYDKNLAAMMLRTRKVYADIFEEKIPVEEKYRKNVPDWKAFDWWGNFWVSRVLWIALYTWFYVVFAPSAWWFLLLPIHIAMGPVHGVVINWFAHKYGHVNFETDNTSRNLFKVDWLMFGEGYHNNHHVFPSRPNFAAQKGEFDPCYPIIYLLHKCGVIRMATVRA
ncbi:MAG: fatty acid desaturase [Flaviaesturariibacter sp.]|nr:fatty acid desaturase [Flaviaesturariibacter sp.]